MISKPQFSHWLEGWLVNNPVHVHEEHEGNRLAWYFREQAVRISQRQSSTITRESLEEIRSQKLFREQPERNGQ